MCHNYNKCELHSSESVYLFKYRFLMFDVSYPYSLQLFFLFRYRLNISCRLIKTLLILWQPRFESTQTFVLMYNIIVFAMALLWYYGIIIYSSAATQCNIFIKKYFSICLFSNTPVAVSALNYCWPSDRCYSVR